MKKLIKRTIRAMVRTPRLRRLAGKSFAKAHGFWRTMDNERFVEIYLRHRDFTRIPPESFVANLEVVESHTEAKGCVVECGVWRGGMCAGMAEILGPERSYYLFDSFEGLPDAKPIDGQTALAWQARNDVENCRTEEDYAGQAMAHAGARKYEIVKGWFDKTLPGFQPDSPIAVLRLDADWYSSTAECLNYLYPLVPKGGLVILDDYFAWDGCARAIHDFLSKNGLSERIVSVDTMLAYFVKTDMRPIEPIDPERVLD